MKFRGTRVALVVAALLGLFVYWHEVIGGRSRDRARVSAKKLLDIDRTQILAIRIKHSGTQFELQPRTNGWILVRPVTAECDPKAIGAYLDTLVAAGREEKIGRGEPQRYGLDAPAAQIEVDVGGRTRTLALGRINPQQTLVYTLVDGSQDVVLTTAALLTMSLNNVFGWRDKRMIDVQPELVQRIQLRTYRDGALALKRDPALGWLVDGDTPWRVDRVRAQSLLLGLSQLTAVGVAAENKTNLSSFGLDNRRVGAQVEVAGGQVRGEVVVGSALADGSYYAMVPDKPEVFRIEGKLIDLMVSLARDPRDRKAFPPFDPDQVTRLGVDTTDDRFVLERRGHDWVVASSTRLDSTFALDPVRMQSVLTDLATLELHDFPAQQPPAGFTAPLITVRLYAGDKQVSALEVGSKDPNGTFTFARGAGEPAVFLVSPTDLIRLPLDPESLAPDEKPAPEGTDRS